MIDIDDELKEYRIGKLNEALTEYGVVELTPREYGIKQMGYDDVLILACSILDYQTASRGMDRGMDVQFMGLDGEDFDITARGKLIVVNDHDNYLMMLEDYEQ